MFRLEKRLGQQALEVPFQCMLRVVEVRAGRGHV